MMEKALELLKNGYSKEVKPEGLLPKKEEKQQPASKSIIMLIAEGYEKAEQK